VEVARFDIDPLIREAVPPSYDFPDEAKQQKMSAGSIYTLQFFFQVVTVALQRICVGWPAAYRDFPRFVRMIIHLPDAEFRSCSADRYSGVILLSSIDESLLDLEESLIHEFGHQILYNVMELDPLIVDAAKRTFRLPWSGQVRDLYGYFHAFYIYILLVRYLERSEESRRRDERRCLRRIAEIMSGLRVALPDLQANGSFTPRGRILFTALEQQIHELEIRHGDSSKRKVKACRKQACSREELAAE